MICVQRYSWESWVGARVFVNTLEKTVINIVFQDQNLIWKYTKRRGSPSALVLWVSKKSTVLRSLKPRKNLLFKSLSSLAPCCNDSKSSVLEPSQYVQNEIIIPQVVSWEPSCGTPRNITPCADRWMDWNAVSFPFSVAETSALRPSAERIVFIIKYYWPTCLIMMPPKLCPMKIIGRSISYIFWVSVN